MASGDLRLLESSPRRNIRLIPCLGKRPANYIQGQAAIGAAPSVLGSGVECTVKTGQRRRGTNGWLLVSGQIKCGGLHGQALAAAPAGLLEVAEQQNSDGDPVWFGKAQSVRENLSKARQVPGVVLAKAGGRLAGGRREVPATSSDFFLLLLWRRNKIKRDFDLEEMDN